MVDNLTAANASFTSQVPLVVGDVRDSLKIEAVLRENRVDTVIHLAALTNARDSVALPKEYYDNNVTGTLCLLNAMVAADVSKIVYASSCSVYGNHFGLAREDDASSPLSPYGESKVFGERLLHSYGRAYGLRWIALRYFNVAGADDGCESASGSPAGARLIPRVIASCLGEGATVEIYGSALGTHDGAAVRDYIHVVDVATANSMAVDYLERGGSNEIVNIGTGAGTSVKQMISAIEAATGSKARVVVRPAQECEPGTIVADPSKAELLLGFRPKRSSVQEIVGSALRQFHRDRATAHPEHLASQTSILPQ